MYIIFKASNAPVNFHLLCSSFGIPFSPPNNVLLPTRLPALLPLRPSGLVTQQSTLPSLLSSYITEPFLYLPLEICLAEDSCFKKLPLCKGIPIYPVLGVKRNGLRVFLGWRRAELPLLRVFPTSMLNNIHILIILLYRIFSLRDTIINMREKREGKKPNIMQDSVSIRNLIY
jgi:hypothetical protein